MISISETEIRPYYPVEVARMYGVSKVTMLRWLEPHRATIGKKIGKYYTALQVKLIFDILGPPGKLLEED